MAERWRLASGTVVHGRIELESETLEEGRRVKVLILDDAPVQVTEAERQFLLNAIAEADRGESVDAFELLAELRRLA
jgi:hypothetical protein